MLKLSSRVSEGCFSGEQRNENAYLPVAGPDFLLVALVPANARNVKLILPIAAAMQSADAQDRPTGAVKFFFRSETPPRISTKIASYVANPRTSALAKSDRDACNGAFLWTLVALERRAHQVGANAVVNVSYYRKNEMSSATDSSAMWAM